MSTVGSVLAVPSPIRTFTDIDAVPAPEFDDLWMSVDGGVDRLVSVLLFSEESEGLA